jgi:DNA repair photolyase
MSLIYEPAGRAREYAALACNVYRGCDHACTYCYAPSATQRTRKAFELSSPRTDFQKTLEREAAALSKTNAAGKQVLLSFTCDPYQALDVTEQTTRRTIQTLHAHGFGVCTLTKGGQRALRDLDLFGPRDAFATSLTLLDPVASRAWEPGAALPDERIDTIRQFHAAGVTTWVSLEPVLDPTAALKIIRLTQTFVDLYKIGKLNHHSHAQTINWHLWANDATALLDHFDKRYYIKDDLRAFLTRQPGNAVTLADLEAPAALPRPMQFSMF